MTDRQVAIGFSLVLVFAPGCGDGPEERSTEEKSSPEATGPSLEYLRHIDEASGVEYGVGTSYDILPDGGVVYLDRQSHVVRVFDANGRYSHSFGGEGGGPGEFNSPGQVEVGPENEIAVSDFMARRVSVFSASGDLLYEFRTPPPAGRPRIRWDAQGLFVQVTGRVDDVPGQTHAVQVLRAVFGEPAVDGESSSTRLVREMALPLSATHGGDPLTCPSCSVFLAPNGGVALVSPKPQYRVVELDFEQNPVATWIRTDRPPAVYTEAEQERFRATQERLYQQLGLGEWKGEPPQTRRQLSHDGVGFDSLGRMWTLPVEAPGVHRSLDILGADGTYLTTLEPPVPSGWLGVDEGGVPFELRSIKVRNNHLLGLARDEWDVPVVVVYRIVN